MSRLSYVFLLYLFSVSISTAQSKQDFNFFSPDVKTGSIEQAEVIRSTDSVVTPDVNEIDKSFKFTFAFYSKFISSQDGSLCRFYPTCSGYCLQAISKNGPIVGLIQAADRFTRCNGLSPHKYEIDRDRKRLIDHVPTRD